MNILVDENGKWIENVKSWDTESRIAVMYVDFSKSSEVVEKHLPNAVLVDFKTRKPTVL